MYEEEEEEEVGFFWSLRDLGRDDPRPRSKSKLDLDLP